MREKQKTQRVLEIWLTYAALMFVCMKSASGRDDEHEKLFGSI